MLNDWIANGPFHDEVGFDFTRTMLEMRQYPTAFIVGQLTMVSGVYRAITARGLKVGRDVSVLAHDDCLPFLSPQAMLPTLSTTSSSLRAAGRRIGDHVVQLVAGRPAAEIAELWPVELVLRESCVPPPG